ncbi:hypothetical protein HPB51_024914 [Rhipicephalus microplus]|uniref:Uncharacterized protein n=1 Tax=Rhipicephalus microplus TaxID=6941 RepID=A0A9J6DX75_RHIMP|nr:hypothetical protein HPB51_024914 [Rhipicephalus microplus]
MAELEALAALSQQVQLLKELLQAQQQSCSVDAHQSSVLASAISPMVMVPCILIPPEFPEFWPGSSATWLVKMESAFCLRIIISLQERYAITVDMLPPSLRCVVPPPGPQAYDGLRGFVLALPQPAVPRQLLPTMRNISIEPRVVTTLMFTPVADSTTSALPTIVLSTLPTRRPLLLTTIAASTTAASSLQFTETTITQTLATYSAQTSTVVPTAPLKKRIPPVMTMAGHALVPVPLSTAKVLATLLSMTLAPAAIQLAQIPFLGVHFVRLRCHSQP